MIISSGKKRQVAVTKQLIADAFIRLINEMPYDEIGVYHILDEAGVARRTFYHHFQGKEKVMEFCLSELMIDYYAEREKLFYSTSTEEGLEVTLSFMYQKRSFIRSLIESGQFDKFATLFNENSVFIYTTFGLPLQTTNDLSEFSREYISKALIGAYLNVVKYWLVQENPASPEIVAKDVAILFKDIPGYFENINTKNRAELSEFLIKERSKAIAAEKQRLAIIDEVR